MQKEQLIFKIVLKFETDQLKTKSTYINQQTPMQNQRSFTELTLDGVQMVPGKIVPCRKRAFDWGEVFMRGSRIFPGGAGFQRIFRFASGGDGVGVAECAGGVFPFCIYSIIKYRTIDENNVYKLDNNYTCSLFFTWDFIAFFKCI